MVLLIEYRIALPFSMEEWKIGHAYMTAKAAKQFIIDTDGEGVRVVTEKDIEQEIVVKNNNNNSNSNNNENKQTATRKGTYRHRELYFAAHLPSWTRKFVSGNSLKINERSTVFYPTISTEYTTPLFSKFKITAKTVHSDKANVFNIHNLSRKELAEREIVEVDIASDVLPSGTSRIDIDTDDPRFLRCHKANRGPLTPGWQNDTTPVMYAYKLVRVEFNYWGLRTRGERLMQSIVRRVYLQAHRQAYCWLDEWYNLTEEDIVKIQEEVKQKTNEKYHEVKTIIAPKRAAGRPKLMARL